MIHEEVISILHDKRSWHDSCAAVRHAALSRSLHDNMHQAPFTMHQAPCNMHQAPCTMHQVPCTMHQVPCNMHQAPCNMHQAPFTMHQAPCNMHQAPFTMHQAPCNMQGEQQFRGVHWTTSNSLSSSSVARTSPFSTTTSDASCPSVIPRTRSGSLRTDRSGTTDTSTCAWPQILHRLQGKADIHADLKRFGMKR
jgi:hypothetical protein